jgi:hypothetical protein
MTYRDELVTLITNGATPGEIFRHFRLLGKHRSTVIDILHDSGVTISIPPSDDNITDERRRYLQELSLDA